MFRFVSSLSSRTSTVFFCTVATILSLHLCLAMTETASAYDAKAFATKKCTTTLCDSTKPAQPCDAYGTITNGACICYTNFTIQFKQKVHLSVTNIDKSCGGTGYLGYFVIWKKDSLGYFTKEAYKYYMENPASSWSKDVEIDKGTYQINANGQWGGNYCVEYWKGAPNCAADLTITPDGKFGNVEPGKCSTFWRDVTFKNNGNMPFQVGGINPGDAAFQLDLTGKPTTLDPSASYTFKVKFCPPSSLTADKTYNPYLTVNYTCNNAQNQVQVAVSGTAHIPIGELSVPTSFNVGEADWTLPAPNNRVDSPLTVKNIGDAAMTVNLAITKDDGGVFALIDGGTEVQSINNIAISGPGAKPVKVRATVKAEKNYVGELSVGADYGGGKGKNATVQLTAKGHHPVPELVLHDSEINYGEVEVDYKFHQAVEVENKGDASLEFEIRLKDMQDLDLPHFACDLGKKQILAGERKLYQMTFSPKNKGNKEIFLIIDNTNEPTPTSHSVRLYGKGVDPVSLSTMLVIDRSYSMNAKAGAGATIRKIEAARDSGILYTEVIEDAWDSLGITAYNDGSATPVTLASISSNRAPAQTVLKDIGPNGKLEPKGATCIGGAMLKAAAEFKGSPPSNALAMIVLTDGKENTPPKIPQAKPQVLGQYPSLKIFCVGIGPAIETNQWALDGIEVAKLQKIAEETKGLFKLAESLTGKKRYDLEAFYFKAFSVATGRQLVVDPVYDVPMSTTSAQPVATVHIETCAREAAFLVMSELFGFPGMENQIVLEDPIGQIITPSSSVGGIAVHVKSWGNCKLFKIKFPPRSESQFYAGPWTVILEPFLTDVDAVIDYMVSVNPSFSGDIPIALEVAVGSDYRLSANLTQGQVLVGEPLRTTAATTEAWWPLPADWVTATVTQPDGSTFTIDLFDDGLHNDGEPGDATYAQEFLTTQKGYHEVLVRSHGVTELKEIVDREITLSKYVGKIREEEEPVPCWDPNVVRAINCGGGLAGHFEADNSFWSGGTWATAATIDTTGVSGPAPQAVYQTERHGDFAYIIGALVPDGRYRVRLHFAEISHDSPGSNVFNVHVNGELKLEEYNLFVEADGMNKAVVEEFSASADAAGMIFIEVSMVTDAKLSGIEILECLAPDFLVVDDFESYTADVNAGEAVFQTWRDGWQNGTGATVGYVEATDDTFGERTIVHGGQQSMPLDYNNVISPYYSEAERAWTTPQDWTVNGADTLVLHVRGRAGNAADQLYVGIEDIAGCVGIVAHPGAAPLTAVAWNAWQTPLRDFSAAGVDVTAVKKMYIGIGDRTAPTPGGAGLIYIDDIWVIRPAP